MNSSIRHSFRFPFLVLLLTSLALPSLLQAQEEEVLFRAMQDELARSVERLKLEDQGTPYFVEYRAKDVVNYSIRSSFGALVESQPSHNRTLAVNVRMGNYDFDNTYLSRADLYNRLGRFSSSNMVIDDNYMALRRDLWLATDKAYKEAIEQMAAKRGFLESREQKDTIADFSRESITTMIESPSIVRFDSKKWDDKLRRWSGIFREYPSIQQSDVAFFTTLSTFYLTNSEGTRIRTELQQGIITISLSTQANDNAPLSRSLSIRFSSIEAPPSDEEIEKTIRELAVQLTSLRNAPMLDKTYIGPVLLMGEASCDLFNQILVPQLSASRLPLLEDESIGGMIGTESELEKRMNLRVMPRFLSAYDDPTVKSVAGTLLTGYYRTDDQGIPAQRVSLIENGVEKGLLTSRRPGKDFPNSNGHGRGFNEAGTTIGNLFIETSEGKSYEELKGELIRYCRDLGLDYGIMIRRGGASSQNSFSGGGMRVMFGSDGDEDTPEAYRVYVKDGREEPLRGISLDQLNLRTLKDIVASGNDQNVLNARVRPSGIASFDMIPAAIVAPSVLLEEVQVNPTTMPKQKPTLLTHPFFANKEGKK